MERERNGGRKKAGGEIEKGCSKGKGGSDNSVTSGPHHSVYPCVTEGWAVARGRMAALPVVLTAICIPVSRETTRLFRGRREVGG